MDGVRPAADLGIDAEALGVALVDDGPELERVGLAHRAGDRLDALSLGNQQRVQLAAALVHDPELLVLDEPFSGLDPMSIENVGAILHEAATQRGVAVIFSSHQLDLVEDYCDAVAIANAGRVVVEGTLGALKRGGDPATTRPTGIHATIRPAVSRHRSRWR